MRSKVVSSNFHTFVSVKWNDMKRILLFSFVLGCIGIGAMAQSRNQTYEAYIQKYKDTAIEEMRRYRIPASITLSQGLLESGAGNSLLAKKSNNHFGIKCGGNWDGPTVSYDDDARNECFRAYRHARESYEDHSQFLRTRPRYAFLFDLDITDYKGWARGLKRAGYATDPSYADRLIRIIELYELYQYDGKMSQRIRQIDAEGIRPHQPFLANDLLYVVAQLGDTFKSIGEEFDISARKVRKYNDLPKDYIFRGGEIVYLESKRTRAIKTHVVHVVRNGESMYRISQMYGIRLKSLYKLNKMSPDAPAPKVGEILRLR